MAEIRELQEADIPEVATLEGIAFRGRTAPASPALHAYLRHVFLDHPWRDLGLRSLVRTGGDGRVVGFLGVIPRPMRFGDRQLRVAVCCRFLSLPDDEDRMGGLHLLRALFGGPQDLSITDSANHGARAVWELLGGELCMPRTMTWTRCVRPFAYLDRLLRHRPVLHALALPLRALQRPLDALAQRRFHSIARVARPEHLSEEQLSDALLLEQIAALSARRALVPVYDQGSLAWLMRCLRDNDRRGEFRAVLLRGADGAVAGWYLYYRNSGGVNEVLQVGAAVRHVEAVVDHLLWRCQEDGAVAVRGRLEPALLDALIRRRMLWSLPDGSWTLVHSPDREITAALHRGDAWFSALEGELWLRSPMDAL